MDRPGLDAYLPADHYRNESDFVHAVPVHKAYQYVSPDGSTFIPAGEDFVSGALYWGVKMSDVLRAFGLAKAVPGKTFYVSDEAEEKTYAAKVASDGTLVDVKIFTQMGGESVTSELSGNVYLAEGQIFVYNPAGRLIDTIDVPERPIDLVFGGKNHKTLFILARTSLYAVEVK
jgi:hypothetical protein